MKKTKVIVGLSGGVDSSVSAWLLQQQGYEVAGMFMKNWEEDDTDTYCSATQDMADAQAVCDQLGIELHKINFATEYWDDVFTHFLNEYRAGRTPNPDVLCNQFIKFDAFLKFALDLNADYIAMGHYAQLHKQDNEFQLIKGLDPLKDQSYFLHRLNQYQLSKSLFPIGHLAKTAVRQIAAEQQFPNHNKKDSTGICFIGERKFKTFLQTYLPAQSGEILTTEGDVISKHDGLMYYTIGQRQGLGIGGQANKPEYPWYVVDKNLEKNQLIVAQGDHPTLYKQTLLAADLHWIAPSPPALPLQCAAKIRYRQADQTCTVVQLNEQHYQVTFTEPQRAVTPGQSIVFYHGEECLGGGIIQ